MRQSGSRNVEQTQRLTTGQSKAREYLVTSYQTRYSNNGLSTSTRPCFAGMPSMGGRLMTADDSEHDQAHRIRAHPRHGRTLWGRLLASRAR